MPGVVPEVVDVTTGKIPPRRKAAMLVIRKPWPGMLRRIWGDPEAAFPRAILERTVKDSYFTGDGANCDADGYFWIMGRNDDVIKVSGHRMGTAEVESALVSHPAVAEAAVVAKPNELTFQSIAAFVTLKDGTIYASRRIARRIEGACVRKKSVPSRALKKSVFTGMLPKTRSGKKSCAVCLRDIAAGKGIHPAIPRRLERLLGAGETAATTED